MAQLKSEIRPAAGAIGPYFTVTEKDSTTVAVAPGMSVANAFNAARDQQVAALSGATITKVTIITITDP